MPGIGEDLAGKIKEIVETGRLSQLTELERQMPGELAELAALPGLGPKRVRVLHEALNISSVKGLKRAIEAGGLKGLAGFGQKTEAKILRAIERRESAAKRTKLLTAQEVAAPLLQYLRQAKAVRQAIVAGSYRRSFKYYDADKLRSQIAEWNEK